MRRKVVVATILFVVVIFSVGFTIASSASEGNSLQEIETDREKEPVACSELTVPSIDDVRANGYPINELGETYGPAVWGSAVEPDLILVCADNGQEGYVRQSELDDGVETLEDAIKHVPSERTVNVYLQDGQTIIGKFTTGAPGTPD